MRGKFGAMMRRLTLALALAVAFCVATLSPQEGSAQSPLALEGPSVEELLRALEFAENAYLYGDFDDVIRVLSPALVPVPAPAEPAQLQRAWLLVGVSARLEGDLPLAELAFLRVLEIDPTYQLDPLLFPAAVIAAFEGVREDNAEYLSALVEPEEEAVTTVYVERSVRTQPRVVSVMPFGVGFFAAGREVGGLSYLVSEMALGSTMVGLYLANEAARNPDGSFDQPVRARRRGRAHQAMAGAFVGLLITNMIHGAVALEQVEAVEYRTLPSLPEELERSAPTSRLRTRRGWAIELRPVFAFE